MGRLRRSLCRQGSRSERKSRKQIPRGYCALNGEVTKRVEDDESDTQTLNFVNEAMLPEPRVKVAALADEQMNVAGRIKDTAPVPRQYSDCGETPRRRCIRRRHVTTMASRCPAVNRPTPSFVAEIRCRSTNRLCGHARGSAALSVRRRAPAAAGSDGDAVVKVILNEMLARKRPLKRGTLADRASMRGVLRIARQRSLAKRQAGSIGDVITAWRIP
jgi:hypothetical protein